jgi:hypothetical protein
MIKQSKIDKTELEKMLSENVPQKEIAQHFGCSVQAISKAAKRLAAAKPPESYQALTPGQKLFVEAKARGLSGTDAALVAFNCESRDSAAAMASRLSKQPLIQDSLRDWLEWAGLTKEFKACRLKQLADSKDERVSLDALRECCKLSSDYPNPRLTIEDKTRPIYVIGLSSGLSDMSLESGGENIVEIPVNSKKALPCHTVEPGE